VFLLSYRNTSGRFGERAMLWEHELTGQCFQSFFKFSETSMSVSKTRKKYGEHVLFLLENNLKKKRTQLVYFYYQNVNSLRSHHHDYKAISACIIFGLFSNIIIKMRLRLLSLVKKEMVTVTA